MFCPGSKKIQSVYPNMSGYAATEGSVAHGIAAEVLKTGNPLTEYLGRSINNIYVGQEMLHYLQVYVDDCQAPGELEENKQFEYEGHTLTGTPDYVCFDEGTLKIKDLKYGYGWVEVFENWQLLAYAVLCQQPSLTTVELTIIQPRASHPEGSIRRWTFPAELLRNYTNQIIGAFEAADADDPATTTGEHCRYCRGLINCHAARAAAGYAIDYIGPAGHTAMTPGMMALEMDVAERAVKMLAQRQTALEEAALAMCKEGKIIPGWEARSVAGALAWNKDIDPVTVGDAMGADLRAPVKAITPTQARDRKLVPAATITSLASRTTGSAKLKRVDYTRAKRILS